MFRKFDAQTRFGSIIFLYDSDDVTNQSIIEMGKVYFFRTANTLLNNFELSNQNYIQYQQQLMQR